MAVVINTVYVPILVLCCMGCMAIAEQQITVHPKDTHVIRGESATLYCKIADQVGVPFWTKNGELFAIRPANNQGDSSDKRWAIFGDESAGEFNLQIVDVMDSDAGLYGCNVTVPQSTSSSSDFLGSNEAALDILPPPDGDLPECVISIEGTLDIGEAVEFTCAYKTDSTDVEMRWTKLDDYSFSPASQETHFREGFAVTQFYRSITRDDHLSQFHCIVDSPELSSPRSCTTGFILVRHAPDVSISPRSPVATVGSRVNLTCLIESSYPMDFSYTWRYKGETIEYYSDKIINMGLQISIGDVGSEDNEAEVSCEAVNAVGSNLAADVIRVTGLSEGTTLTWIIPTVIVLVMIAIVIIIASIVLEGRFCCGRYVRRKRLNASGWSAEHFVLQTQLQTARERRNSDATNDFFLTRTIATPNNDVVKTTTLHNQRNDLSYIPETAIDNINHSGHYPVRPENQTDYGRFGDAQRAQREFNARNERDRMRQNRTQNPNPNPNPKSKYAELNGTSTPYDDVNGSPMTGFSDSGLDYLSSSHDESRSPSPGQEKAPIYSQVRRGKMPRLGSRLSVEERQAIMDEL